MLEEKWDRSEQRGSDDGRSAAIDAYLALGAPSPESTRDGPAAGLDPIDDDTVEIDPLAATETD